MASKFAQSFTRKRALMPLSKFNHDLMLVFDIWNAIIKGAVMSQDQQILTDLIEAFTEVANRGMIRLKNGVDNVG
jgi:hypothetical protein